MPLSKRAISARAAGAIGRRLTQPDNSTRPTDAKPAGNIAQPSPDILSGGAESDSDSSVYESGDLSEEEDERPMAEAQRKSPGEQRAFAVKRYQSHRRETRGIFV